jgi:hypothetical protein
MFEKISPGTGHSGRVLQKIWINSGLILTGKTALKKHSTLVVPDEASMDVAEPEDQPSLSENDKITQIVRKGREGRRQCAGGVKPLLQLLLRLQRERDFCKALPMELWTLFSGVPNIREEMGSKEKSFRTIEEIFKKLEIAPLFILNKKGLAGSSNTTEILHVVNCYKELRFKAFFNRSTNLLERKKAERVYDVVQLNSVATFETILKRVKQDPQCQDMEQEDLQQICENFGIVLKPPQQKLAKKHTGKSFTPERSVDEASESASDEEEESFKLQKVAAPFFWNAQTMATQDVGAGAAAMDDAGPVTEEDIMDDPMGDDDAFVLAAIPGLK